MLINYIDLVYVDIEFLEPLFVEFGIACAAIRNERIPERPLPTFEDQDHHLEWLDEIEKENDSDDGTEAGPPATELDDIEDFPDLWADTDDEI